MAKNFVSISAVSDSEQLSKIHQIYIDEDIQFPLAIGYQMSSKSINKGTQNARQPDLSEIDRLDRKTRDYDFITAVHYYTKDNATIIEDLERVVDMGVEPKSAILQLNTLPASVDTLKAVRRMGFDIIFKVAVSDQKKGGYAIWKGEGVQDAESGDVVSLVDQVYERKDFISYAMFDPSHGTNLGLNLAEDSLALRFGREVVTRPELGDIGLVYAGGINPENVGQLTQTLTSSFPDKVSIDVESGVRTDNKLDMDKIRKYLANHMAARTEE